MDWNKLTVVKLKEELTNRGLATTGKKADLVQRLSEAGAETDDATRKRKASDSDAEPGDDGGDAAEKATNGKIAGKLAGKKRPAVTKTRQAVGKKGTSADDGAGVEGAGAAGVEAGEAGEIDSPKAAGAQPAADGQQGPDAKRARSASGPDGQDTAKGADPLVKIENALNAERFANIDAGTKRRLAVILDFTKLPPSTLDDAVLEQLRSLSQAEATEIMKQLDHSVRTSKVRKISAYLSSMIRRAKEERSAGRDGGPGIMKVNAAVEDLAPEARDILSDLTARRHLREGDLDGKVLGTLAAKPPAVQAFMLKAFAKKNVADVRNMAAFFVSHMRDMDRGLESGRYSLDRVPGEGGGRDHHGRNHHGRDHHGRDKKPVREHRNPHPDIYDPHYSYVPTSLRAAQHAGGGFDGHNQLPAPFQHQHQPPPQQPPFQNQGYDPREQPYARGPPHQPQQSQQSHQPQPEPKHFALEQVQWGVRVDELNGLSDWAKYVHPAAALRMQQLWDQEENKLVSVLDDNSWLLLAGLDAPNSVRAVNETVERMKLSADDVLTVNRLFVEAASKYPRREDAPSMVTSMPSALGAAPVVSNLPPQSTTYGNPLFENPNQPARGGSAPYGGGGYAQPPTALAYAAPPTAYAVPTSQVFLPGPAGNLSPRLQNRIDAVMGNPKWLGRIVVDHFNEHVVNLMLQLDERTNMIVLDEFEREDSSKIRNPKAFLIGKIRQALERRDGAGGHRGDGLPRGGHRR